MSVTLLTKECVSVICCPLCKDANLENCSTSTIITFVTQFGDLHVCQNCKCSRWWLRTVSFYISRLSQTWLRYINVCMFCQLSCGQWVTMSGGSGVCHSVTHVMLLVVFTGKYQSGTNTVINSLWSQATTIQWSTGKEACQNRSCQLWVLQSKWNQYTWWRTLDRSNCIDLHSSIKAGDGWYAIFCNGQCPRKVKVGKREGGGWFAGFAST